MSKRFEISLEENNVSNEGLKGAAFGFMVGFIPGAIIGHYWQEYLIKKEKEKQALQKEIKELKASGNEAGAKQKLEFAEFREKELTDEINKVKPKVAEEEKLNKKIEESKKKVSKEELTENTEEIVPIDVPPTEPEQETPPVEPAATQEEPTAPAAKQETELVVYCKIGYFEGLKEAVHKERQDQYEIKSSQEISGNKGCVRVRKTTDSEGVKFVQTNKVRTQDENLSVAQELNIDITEEHFNMFAAIAPGKTIKDRFIFMVKDVSVNKFGDETVTIDVPELKFEVDVFPKEEGGYHEWCKIDIELDPLLEAIKASGKDISEFNLNIKVNHLPFKPTEPFVGAEANEEQNLILDKFYQEIFFVKL